MRICGQGGGWESKAPFHDLMLLDCQVEVKKKIAAYLLILVLSPSSDPLSLSSSDTLCSKKVTNSGTGLGAGLCCLGFCIIIFIILAMPILSSYDSCMI